MSTVPGWYEIHFVNKSGKEIGLTDQPIPPSIGDKANVHFNPGNRFRVIDREFDYTRGLYVIITLDVD